MKRAIAIAGLALATLAGTGCQVQYQTPDGRKVVVISNDEQGPIDVSPPDRLDIVGISVDLCEDHGGELIAYPNTTLRVCEGVDY